MIKNLAFLISVFLMITTTLPSSALAEEFDPRNVKEVILVRGSKLRICPYDEYSDAVKTRINDASPYYSMNEYTLLHPNPMQDSSRPDCKDFLYGQIELVPFGKEPTYIPTEYIYIFDNKVIRESKVFLTQPIQFSDEREIYKKTVKFSAIDEGSGDAVEIPNTIFWFRGNEVYGKIGDVMEGVIVYQGTYYRHDGAQTFLNHTTLWRNPESEPINKDFIVNQPETVTTPFPTTTPPPNYPSPIPWKQAVYLKEIEGRIRPNDLPSPLGGADLPAPRFVGYEVTLPESLASTQGLVAIFKTCADEACSQSYKQGTFLTDDLGRLVDWTYNWDVKEKVIDLNTDYLRTYRKVYVIAGTSKTPPAEGVRYKFYFGPLKNYPVALTPTSSPTPVSTAAPAIASVSPSQASQAAEVKIQGNNFRNRNDGGYVCFATEINKSCLTTLSVGSWTDTEIKAYLSGDVREGNYYIAIYSPWGNSNYIPITVGTKN